MKFMTCRTFRWSFRNKTLSKKVWILLSRFAKRRRKFVKACQHNTKPQDFLHPVEVGTPFETVGIDILIAFLKSNSDNTGIVVVIDYATSYAEYQALPNSKNSNTVTSNATILLMNSNMGTFL